MNALMEAEADCGQVEVVTTLSDKLKRKKLRLETELNDVNLAIEALQANPEVANVINLLTKAIGRL